VLQAAREAWGGSDRHRVVYTSSASIYGNARTLPTPEDERPDPVTPYAVSKLAGEHYCLVYHEMYGVSVSIVRYSNIYGVGQTPMNPYCGVIAKMFKAAQFHQPFTLHGDGEQTRDFTYVSDAVDATLLAAVQPRAEGEVFNVGSGIETSVNTLVRTAQEVIALPIRVEHVDKRDIDNMRRRVMNVEKARRMMKWVPQVALAEGLRKTADWMRVPRRDQ
jgi:UDP-glucose 4-epimerase